MQATQKAGGPKKQSLLAAMGSVLLLTGPQTAESFALGGLRVHGHDGPELAKFRMGNIQGRKWQDMEEGDSSSKRKQRTHKDRHIDKPADLSDYIDLYTPQELSEYIHTLPSYNTELTVADNVRDLSDIYEPTPITHTLAEKDEMILYLSQQNTPAEIIVAKNTPVKEAYGTESGIDILQLQDENIYRGLTIGKQIGFGFYGTVHEVTGADNGQIFHQKYVLKTIPLEHEEKPASDFTPTPVGDFLKEACVQSWAYGTLEGGAAKVLGAWIDKRGWCVCVC